jgi:hypothetical protein
MEVIAVGQVQLLMRFEKQNVQELFRIQILSMPLLWCVSEKYTQQQMSIFQ